MISENFVIVGAILSVVGDASYLFGTLKGAVRPNRVSWLLWAFAPLLAFSAEVTQHVGLTSLMTLAIGIGPLLIFAASFVNRKTSWRLTRFDIVCGCLSFIGLILWQVTGSGNVAIVFSILADLLAGVPTLVKSHKDPESENWQAYFFSALSGLIALLAIDKWTFANYAFPLYILLICSVFVALIKFKVGAQRGLAIDKLVAGEDIRPLP